jgi:hypothetical protein
LISFAINVDNVSNIIKVFDTIQIRKYIGSGSPSAPVSDLVAFSDYTTISGIDTINNRTDISDIALSNNYNQYYFTDPFGYGEDWYIYRYYDSGDSATSSWSDPFQGGIDDIYYNPQFPVEITYEASDQMIIDRIRLYIGDPIELVREYGDEALSSIHADGKTYELDVKGWPAYINMGGLQYNTINDPSINGYKFLRFKEFIDDVCEECVTYSGSCGEDVTKDVTHGVDIWAYTFRYSDREIMEAYNNCPPPSPLTISTANSEVYMIQTAIDLLRAELWRDATEDGATVVDEGTSYNPSTGLTVRRDLLKDLLARRDALVKALQLTGIAGVLID